MNRRTLGIALALSVGLNLFGLGAVGAFWLGQSRAPAEAQPEPQPRQRSAIAIIDELSPDVRQTVRERMRASALAARPDFEEARAQRRAAVAAARAESYDAAAVRALLQASREAEMRGRTRLEMDSVALLGELDLSDRQTLSRVLVRRGRGNGSVGGRDGDARQERRTHSGAPQTQAPAA